MTARPAPDQSLLIIRPRPIVPHPRMNENQSLARIGKVDQRLAIFRRIEMRRIGRQNGPIRARQFFGRIRRALRIFDRSKTRLPQRRRILLIEPPVIIMERPPADNEDFRRSLWRTLANPIRRQRRQRRQNDKYPFHPLKLPNITPPVNNKARLSHSWAEVSGSHNLNPNLNPSQNSLSVALYMAVKNLWINPKSLLI